MTKKRMKCDTVVHKRTGYYVIGDNFVKCEPIFIILHCYEEN